MMTGIKAALIAYLLVNLIVFAMYGIDKAKAVRNEWRIPEKTLIGLAVLGAPGALLAMFVFRHKTKRWYFRVFFPLMMVVQAAVLGYLWSRGILG